MQKNCKIQIKKVEAITDDIELLDAISCEGLKLKMQSERMEEPKTIDADEEDSVDTTIDDDAEDNSSNGGLYYHLDLIIFCN